LSARASASRSGVVMHEGRALVRTLLAACCAIAARNSRLTRFAVTNRDFCVVKCAEYLSELSASSPTAFSALSMCAVRFLLLRAALMEARHDTTLETIATVISSVSSIVASNFPALLCQPDARMEVIAILEVDAVGNQGRSAARMRPVTVLERLFRLQQQFGLKNWTKLLVKLLQIGGLAAMKVGHVTASVSSPAQLVTTDPLTYVVTDCRSVLRSMAE
jgi:hypothetical protein